MFDRQKIIDCYRLRQTENSVIIDEHRGLFETIFDLIFGLVFMFPFFLLLNAFFVDIGWLHLKNGWLGMEWEEQKWPPAPPIWGWPILMLIYCMIFFFAYIGFSSTFARSHVEATSGKILISNTWFGVPVKLKTTPVSKISSVQIKWELSGGVFTRQWRCDVSALTVNVAKPVQLFSCSKKEAALELANAVAEITKLPVQDIPHS
ncbi:MAG TPA: hypothetical protein VMD27_13805 [Candidatus Aquilonibacter sp.]|nr:hypothetical protein [Candidatus Aquilonibacter sp.]